MKNNKYKTIDKVAKLQSSLNENLKGKHILVRCMVNEHRFTLFARHPNRRIAPASTTKIFLLNVLMQNNIDLNAFIRVKESDLSKGSSNNSKCGQHYRIYDLIINLMTASSNTAAKVLARYLERLLEKSYIDYINSYPTGLGLNNTNLVSEHGLAHRQQYTTLNDLAIILDQKMQDHDFLKMMNTASYPFQSREGDEVSIENTYQEIRREECIGVKTGTLVIPVAHECQHEAYFFMAKGIEFENKKILGKTLVGNQVVEKNFDFPDVVQNRLEVKEEDMYAYLKLAKLVPFSSNRIGDKNWSIKLC